MPDRRLTAAQCALDSTALESSEDHGNLILRKLDLAIAMSSCNRHLEKQRLLAPLLRLKVHAQDHWLILVGCLEHARASLALGDDAQTKRSLRPLWKLRKDPEDAYLSLLVAEGLCLYARAALRQGNKTAAVWKTLGRALRISEENAHVKGSPFVAISALRAIADCQVAKGSFRSATETLRRVTSMLEQLSRGDTYTVACSQVDESAAHISTGNLAESRRLLRLALPELRKRKGGHCRTSEAAILMASLLVPKKRIRGRTHPECFEEECALVA